MGIGRVAVAVANWLNKFTTHFELDLASVHLIGHSLGGQMVGLIGRTFTTDCRIPEVEATQGERMSEYCKAQEFPNAPEIGRITGLDPAGPYFAAEDTLVPWVLRPEYAKFVDVIHSN